MSDQSMRDSEATVIITDEPAKFDLGSQPAPQGMPAAPGMAPQQGMPVAPGMAPQQGMPVAPGMAPQQGMPVAPGMAPQQGMPMAPGMAPQQGMPMAPGMPPQGAPQKPAKVKKPKKKLSGGALAGIIIGVVVLLAGVGVGVFFIIKSLSPDEEEIKAALPEEITNYTLDWEEYESTVKSVVIEEKISNNELECKIVLDDENFERTVYCEIEFEKEDGEWEVDSFEYYDDSEIVIKQEYAAQLLAANGYENATFVEDVTEKKSSTYKYEYDVSSEATYATVSGNVILEMSLEEYAYEDDMTSLYVGSYVDDSDVEFKWNLEGSYIEDAETVTMGITITETGEEEYDVEFASSVYGAASDSAYVYIYSDCAELYVYTYNAADEYVDYYLCFTPDSFELEIDSESDGYEEMTMKPGQFSQQEAEPEFNFEDYID